MGEEPAPPRSSSLERRAFTALVAALLAPVVAHGLWRPLVHVFGAPGKASSITAVALAISGACALAPSLYPARALPLSLALGGLLTVGATLGLSLGVSGLLTLLVVAVAIAWLVHLLPSRLSPALDGLGRRHRLLTLLYVVVALASVRATARLSVFVGDPTRIDQQVLAGEAFLDTHSCLTAYVRAAALARQRVDNLYAERWWNGAEGLPPLPAGVENPYRPFHLDYYAYPPPFLFVVAPLAPFEGDFAAQRALWFGLNGLLLAVGLWTAARWIDAPRAHRIVLLAPLFFGSLPVLVTLQIGNFQVAVVVMSVLAMVAFERGRAASGGALLALTILSKLSPGVLGIALVAQRRWRSVAFTAAFALVFLGLSVLTQGVNPLESFLGYALPRVSSGAAFAFLDDAPLSIITNMAPFGLPFKLQLAGVDVGEPWVLGRWLGRIYSVVLLVVAVVAARRPADRRTRAVRWMALLVLGALQSPFAPGYVLVGLLWAMTLLSVEVQSYRGGIALMILALFLTVFPPLRTSLLAAYALVPSLLALGVPVWLLLRVAPESAAHQ